MKKTIKKQMILIAVITVMMICSLVMSVSAEGIPCEDGVHNSSNYILITYAPSCEQMGYTVTYCDYCDETVDIRTDMDVKKLGHNYAVSYEKKTDENGKEYYERVLTCQRDACIRVADEDRVPTGRSENSVIADEATYYSVEFVNRFESPVLAQKDHADYFNSEYYVKNAPSTWLAEDYMDKTYAPGTETNDSGAVVSPAYELIEEADGINLYVKSGEKAFYEGDETPYRNKDEGIGKYTFTGWAADGTALADKAITGNTVFEAQFNAEKIFVTYSYWANGIQISEEATVEYGGTVTAFNHAVPTRAGNAESHYEFIGWNIGTNKNVLYTDTFKLYHTTEINAAFETVANEYTIKFVDYKGNEFADAVSTGVQWGKTAEGINKIDSSMLTRPKDKKYVYAFADRWSIAEVAYGEESYTVTTSYNVNPQSLSLPSKLTGVNSEGNLEEVVISDGCTITLTPVYYMNPIQYSIKVSIKTVYFEKEDQFEDNSIIRTDILDDFTVQVTDANGQYVAGGRTDENGDFTFNVNYSDVLYVTAASDNGKYRGEQTLYLGAVDNSAFVLGIAPSVTDEWREGNTHSCSCICHSFLSPIVIRIYNILYRVFGIKYVCCDDMFATHGSILAYTK